METLCPNHVIVLLGERGAGDLSMVTPYLTLGADHILAVDVHGMVELNGLREVIAPGGDLRNRLGIGNEEADTLRAHNEKGVALEVVEWFTLEPVAPFVVQQARPLSVSARS